ncbi:MAG: T9SS type A sorting domain-containing protein [Bacteroidota bacterium]
MRRLRYVSFLLATLLPTLAALAQVSPTKVLPQQAPRVAAPGDCDPGTATTDLDVGGVRARLYNRGGFFGAGGSLYVVPKDSGVQALFALGAWLGGTVDNQPRFTGSLYGDEEWGPGPLDASGAPPADCGAAFDRIWLVTQQPDGSLAGDVDDWPADLGAPFEDLDGDGVYEPEAGETPTLYGHQTAFWVMNDRTVPPSLNALEPLGVTARVTAFTFNSTDPALGFGTFYRYEFENPNAYTVENARFGLFTDPDLGDFTDDLVGSDPERGLSFAYNGDPFDGTGGENFPTYRALPPALGVDILSGTEGFISPRRGTLPASDWEDTAYQLLNFLWEDGTPLTVGGSGYNPDQSTAAPSTWHWPGGPERFAFWSEFNLDAAGQANEPDDRRSLSVATPFTLPPGATHTVDVAMLWGRGVSFLNSVAQLRDHSDRVQAAYDSGALFGPAAPQDGTPDGTAPPPPLITLPTPTPSFPEDEADLARLTLPEPDPDCVADRSLLACTTVSLSWEAVPGATYYEVQISDTDDFSESIPLFTRTPALESVALTSAEPSRVYWRVRANTSTELSAFSPARFYTTRFEYVPAIREVGIVEVAYGGTPTCAPDDPRLDCALAGGVNVWLRPNPTNDYYVTSWRQGRLDRIEWRIDIAAPFDYEMRFTEACAAGECYGINYLLQGNGEVVSVPFELWQTGIDTPDDPTDDVQLIPVLLRPVDGPTIERWRYAVATNPGNGDDVEDTNADFDALASDAIYWMYPDRPDGHARFAEAAATVGIGNVLDGFDTQIDLDPSTGEPCERQGFFVDFCHRNDELPDGADNTDFISLISRFQLADQAGDGTPPPAGTVLRVLTTKQPPPVSEEEPPPSIPQSATLAVFPNPSQGLVTVEYGQASRDAATVEVFDTVGRLVTRLDEGMQDAGVYTIPLDLRDYAAGLYFVVFRSADTNRVFPISVFR